jgi:uncharacterized membrane protein YcaP (DUF421 family)
MTELWTLGTPALLIVLRSVVVYAVLVLGFRLAGKREIGQFTPFDLVLILLIANAVQNAMVGTDTSLLGGIIAAITLLGINWIVGAFVKHSPELRHAALGEPTVLVQDGATISSGMDREDVTEEELLAAIREHGFGAISDVGLAVLEVDGSISVVPVGAHIVRTRRRIRQIKHGS